MAFLYVPNGVNMADWTPKNEGVLSELPAILDPLKNLSCGIRVLDSIVGKQNRISLESGHYWSVLMSGSKYSKVESIQAMTRALAVCKP